MLIKLLNARNEVHRYYVHTISGMKLNGAAVQNIRKPNNLWKKKKNYQILQFPNYRI